MKRISVDWENSSEEWWDAAREADESPAPIRFLIETDADAVVVSDDEALDVIAWAEQLPGWTDGPDYAPTALTVHDA